LLHEIGRLNLSVSRITELVKTVVNEGLVELNAHTLEVVATMASNTAASLHLNDSEALHDLVMSEVSNSASISLQSTGSSVSANHDIVSFIFRDGNGAVHDIANFTESLLNGSINFLSLLLLNLNSFVTSLGLGRLSRDISLLVGLLLGSDDFRAVILLFLKTIQSVLC